MRGGRRLEMLRMRYVGQLLGRLESGGREYDWGLREYALLIAACSLLWL